MWPVQMEQEGEHKSELMLEMEELRMDHDKVSKQLFAVIDNGHVT